MGERDKVMTVKFRNGTAGYYNVSCWTDPERTLRRQKLEKLGSLKKEKTLNDTLIYNFLFSKLEQRKHWYDTVFRCFNFESELRIV